MANVRRYVALRRVAVARVFALVVRCRVMMLFVNSRVGKNRDTKREPPAGAGAGRTAYHLMVHLSQKILAVRSANDIYRPVRDSNRVCFMVTSFCQMVVTYQPTIYLRDFLDRV